MEEMVWEAPEARSYVRRRFHGKIRALAERPGHWARLETFDDPHRAYSTRGNLSANGTKRYAFPDEAEGLVLKFKVRKLPGEPKWGLYGRAVPSEPYANCPNHPDTEVWTDEFGRWCSIDECQFFLGEG